MEPIVKWAGGKRRILKHILPLVPKEYGTYCEPFVGGGAVWLSLLPSKAIINDVNAELILTYKTVKTHVDEVVRRLKECPNDEQFYYEMRESTPENDIETAVRFLYLNHTCYNGLYRVNSQGRFNVPFGRYEDPDIVQEEKLKQFSEYLNKADVIFVYCDFYWLIEMLEKGDFVYLDPPYDKLDAGSFTQYTLGDFDRRDQVRLQHFCDKLSENGVSFLMSNACTDFVKGAWSKYICKTISTKRSIGSDADSRSTPVKEVLIRNY